MRALWGGHCPRSSLEAEEERRSGGEVPVHQKLLGSPPSAEICAFRSSSLLGHQRAWAWACLHPGLRRL